MGDVRDAIYNAACKGNGKIDRLKKRTTPEYTHIGRITDHLRDVLEELPEGTTVGEILEELDADQ